MRTYNELFELAKRKNVTAQVQEVLFSASKLAEKHKLKITIDSILYEVLKYYEKRKNPIGTSCDLNDYFLCFGKTKDNSRRKNNIINVADDVYEFFKELPQKGEKTLSYILWNMINLENSFSYEKRPYIFSISNYEKIERFVKFEYYRDGFFKINSTNPEIVSIFERAYEICSSKEIWFNLDALIFAIFEHYSKSEQIHPIIKICSFEKYETLFENMYMDPVQKKREYFLPRIPNSMDFIYTFLNDDISIEEFFYKTVNSFDEDDVRNSILVDLPEFSIINETLFELYTQNRKNSIEMNHIYRTELSVNSCTDLTHEVYLNGCTPIIGREKELMRIKRILCKCSKNNPLIIGKPGVGKTKLVKALAEEFVYDKVPEMLQGTRILSLSISELNSGTKFRGTLEAKFIAIKEICRKEKVILFIDEIHNICKNSSEVESVADILKPDLLDSDITIIGATTFEDYSLFENDSALERRFDLVKLEEPSIAEAIDILDRSKSIYEKRFSIEITTEIIEEIVKLSDRYIQVSSLPDKAFDVLDEACAMIKIEEPYTQCLKLEHVCKIITEKTGIPTAHIESDEREKLKQLDEKLSNIIIGQEEAISAIVNALKKARLGLNNQNKPIASFLFAGTTGVGKTETANVLAEEYFGSKEFLVRFDMSEYQTIESVQKFIGSAPGYVGYSDGGQLTRAVKHNPYSVILFDEIEKAHPDVLNILLQILDAGILKDNKGRCAIFKNTIIILTTNLGSEAFQKKSLGFGNSNIRQNQNIDAMNAIKNSLRPELFNRIDNVVVFNTLGIEDCKKILKNIINKFEIRLSEKEIELEITDTVIEYLIETGYDSKYGARDLQRIFDKKIVSPLAQLLVDKGNIDFISIDMNDNEIDIYSTTFEDVVV